jgi:hypothetical protein
MDIKNYKLKTVRIQNIKNFNRSHPECFPVPDKGRKKKKMANEKRISCLQKLNALTGQLLVSSDAWKDIKGHDNI